MKFLFLLLAVVFTMASCSTGATKCSKETTTDSLKVVVATDSMSVTPDSVKKAGK